MKDQVSLEMNSEAKSVLLKKRNRKSNFSMKEIDVMLQSIKQHKHIVLSHSVKAYDNALKCEVWNQITDEINKVGEAKRSQLEVKKKWMDLKVTAVKCVTRQFPASKQTPPYCTIIMDLVKEYPRQTSPKDTKPSLPEDDFVTVKAGSTLSLASDDADSLSHQTGSGSLPPSDSSQAAYQAKEPLPAFSNLVAQTQNGAFHQIQAHQTPQGESSELNPVAANCHVTSPKEKGLTDSLTTPTAIPKPTILETYSLSPNCFEEPIQPASDPSLPSSSDSSDSEEQVVLGIRRVGKKSRSKELRSRPSTDKIYKKLLKEKIKTQKLKQTLLKAQLKSVGLIVPQ